MRILFIENHKYFSTTVTEQFLNDHKVTVTPTMARARNLMRDQRFDLVLVDFDLDDGKGAEIVSEITSSDPRPKIIATSSHEYGNTMILEAGADAVCSKMNFDQIREIIEGVFREADTK